MTQIICQASGKKKLWTKRLRIIQIYIQVFDEHLESHLCNDICHLIRWCDFHIRVFFLDIFKCLKKHQSYTMINDTEFKKKSVFEISLQANTLIRIFDFFFLRILFRNLNIYILLLYTQFERLRIICEFSKFPPMFREYISKYLYSIFSHEYSLNANFQIFSCKLQANL